METKRLSILAMKVILFTILLCPVSFSSHIPGYATELIIRDTRGVCDTLYFGFTNSSTTTYCINYGDTIDVAQYGISVEEFERPPLPPDGIFDARFVDNRIGGGACLGQGIPVNFHKGGIAVATAFIDTFRIFIQGSLPSGGAFPMTLSWKLFDSTVVNTTSLNLKYSGDEGVQTISMMAASTTTISDPSVSRLSIYFAGMINEVGEGGLNVAPAKDFEFFGMSGGPFSPSRESLYISNTGESPITWLLQHTQPWVTFSATGGTLSGGGYATIVVTLNDSAKMLLPNVYSDTIKILNTTNGIGNCQRIVRLTVGGNPSYLYVKPTDRLIISGTVGGGPFFPRERIYTLVNAGDDSLYWQATKRQSWSTLSATAGPLRERDSAFITYSLNSTVYSLPLGTYLDTIFFSSMTGMGSATCVVQLNVIAIETGAEVRIPVRIWDNSNGRDTLNFGFDTLATRCIDGVLGEWELPPLPPDGIFDARFIDTRADACMGSGSTVNIHPFPAIGVADTFRIQFQGSHPAGGGYPFHFSWPGNLSTIFSTLRFQYYDPDSGVVIMVDMLTQTDQEIASVEVYKVMVIGTLLPHSSLGSLFVYSSNPDSGVAITVSPSDTDGFSDGVTPFQRLYSTLSTVSLTAPPMAGNNVFVEWQKNGVPYSSNRLVALTLEYFTTMTARYESSSSSIVISVDSIMALGGDTVEVPVHVLFPDDALITSGEITFSGYGENLTFLGIDTTQSMIGGQQWLYETHELNHSLNTAFAGADAISGSGILFRLKFFVQPSSSGWVPITLTYTLFNSTLIAERVYTGGVNVISLMSGDVDLGQSVHANDASLLLQSLVGYIALNPWQQRNANVSCDTTISAWDASLILKKVVGSIESLPYCGNLTVSGTVRMNTPPPQGDDTVLIPIVVNNVSNVGSFEGKITYNSQHLSLEGVNWESVAGDFTIIKRIDGIKGELLFAGASSSVQTFSGVLGNLVFHINRGTFHTTSINLATLRLNEDPVLQNVATVSLSVTAVDEQQPDLPGQFILYQNTPNPFNPSTVIRYSLPEQCYVRLSVYSMLGRVVATLVDEMESAGVKTVTFTAVDLPSGLYYYRLETGQFMDVKKMIILK